MESTAPTTTVETSFVKNYYLYFLTAEELQARCDYINAHPRDEFVFTPSAFPEYGEGDAFNNVKVQAFFAGGGVDLSLLGPVERVLALQIAASKNLLSIVKLLVDAGTSCTRMAGMSSHFFSAFLAAVHANATESALYILEHGKNVLFCSERLASANLDTSPIKQAIEHRNLVLIEALFAHKDSREHIDADNFLVSYRFLKRAIKKSIPVKPFLVHWKEYSGWFVGQPLVNIEYYPSPFTLLLNQLQGEKSNERHSLDYVLQTIDDLKSAGFGVFWGADSDEILPFHNLARSPHYTGWKEVTNKLIEVGFNPLETDDGGCSVMHRAMDVHKHVELALYLSFLNVPVVSSEFCSAFSSSSFSNKHL
jgi:hypothetical protein